MKPRAFVTAGEIGEYAYCPRAWWLGYRFPRRTLPILEAGTRLHDRLFLSLRSMRIMARLIQLIIVSGLVLAVFSLLWLLIR